VCRSFVNADSRAFDRECRNRRTCYTANSFFNAIECGKQSGDNPACLFWDTDLCKNDDFVLAWYTPYKQVAYEVWTAVRHKKPALVISSTVLRQLR
jgi:hypothetical protein